MVLLLIFNFVQEGKNRKSKTPESLPKKLKIVDLRIKIYTFNTRNWKVQME